MSFLSVGEWQISTLSVIRIDDPGDLSAAAEEILQARVDFGAGVVWREDFDCQIGSAGEELPGARQFRFAIQKPVLESRTAPRR